MKISTGIKYDLPFESYTSIISEVGGTQVVTWTKAYDSTGLLVQGGGGVYLVTDEPLPVGSQVRNLKDSMGQAVFVLGGEPYPMYVNSSDPQFDPFTRIIGWKHALRRDLPREYSQVLDGILS